MPRPQPRTRERQYQISPEMKAFFITGLMPEDPSESLRIQQHTWDDAARGGLPSLREVWTAFSAELTEDFAIDYPGQRPWAWWKYSAPELRRQLSGGGRPAHEVPEKSGLSRPIVRQGIPILWVETGREGDPIFESSAAYLQRLNLLFPDEEQNLTAEAFDPIVFDTDLEDA